MNVNTDRVFSEYVLKAMQGIRKSKLTTPRQLYRFDHVTKNLKTNAEASFIDTTNEILLNNNIIKNRPTNKGNSLNDSCVSNDVFGAFYVDYIEFKK